MRIAVRVLISIDSGKRILLFSQKAGLGQKKNSMRLCCLTCAGIPTKKPPRNPAFTLTGWHTRYGRLDPMVYSHSISVRKVL